LLQGAQQGDQNPAAGSADGVAQGAGAAVHIDLGRVQLQVMDGGHGDHGEGFVDFPQIHVGGGPAHLLQDLFHGAHGGGGEPGRFMGIGAVTQDFGDGGKAQFLGLGFPHYHHGGSAVGNGGGVGGGDRAVLLEGGLQTGDFFHLGLGRLFVVFHNPVALAAAHRDRGDFPLEVAAGDGLLGPGGGGDGEFVLGLTGEAVLGGRVFGEGAHQPALVVGVFQTVEEHVVENLAMAQPVTAPGFRQQVGGVGHGFLTASHGDVEGTGENVVMGQHHRLQGGTADLLNGGGAGGQGQTGADGGLPGGGLTDPGHQHIAEQHFIHLFGLDAGSFHGRLDGHAAQLGGGQGGEITLETTQGSPGGGNDNDRVGHSHSLS